MSGSQDTETCVYTAEKGDPSNWHGDSPDDWVLDSEAPVGLEQEDWTCPHEALDGSEHCAFHTSPDDVPDEIDEGELFVKAINEASAVNDEERARRKKEFVGATFGAFDIEGATLDADDVYPIRFEHATFVRGVNAKNAVFEHSVLVTRARFETGDREATDQIGTVSFSRVEFGGGGVSFSQADFGEGQVSFSQADFGEGQVSFAGTVFGEGIVSFFRVEFGEGEVSFVGAEFGERGVSFVGAEFGEGGVSFVGAEFGEGGVSFGRATVNAHISFLNTRFDVNSTVVLSDAEFRDKVTFGSSDDESVPYAQHSLDFSGATFHRKLEFHSRADSITRAKQSGSGEPQFDFVFIGDVDFSGVTFPDGADFSTTRFPPDTDFSEATLESADFSGADVTGTVDISEASFDGANMTGADLSDATLTGASFERARLSRAEFLGANLTGTKIYGALMGDARINRDTSFWLNSSAERWEQANVRLPIRVIRGVKNTLGRERNPYCAYDPRYRGPEADPDLEKAVEVYGTLETLARQNSLSRLASECFLGRKDVQLRHYWRDGETWMVIRSLVPNVVARYGESAGRVLGSGALVTAVCGFTYHALNLIERADSGSPVTLFESLYFSALTFTTLGYGDFTPSNSAGQVLAVAETSLGVILLAILVFVFGRRATR